VRRLSYRELHERGLPRRQRAAPRSGSKGERVIIYMGMVPEAAIAMLACARLGAIHSVVFGGFSAEALRDRVRDCGAECVITQDEGGAAASRSRSRPRVDAALEGGRRVVRHVLVYRAHTGAAVAWTRARRVVARRGRRGAPADHAAVGLRRRAPAVHPLHVGSTGRPKGLVHTCGGYLTYVAYTHQVVRPARGRRLRVRRRRRLDHRATATSCTARSPTARPR
jgi:acetyl-CoA synthetase